MRCTIGLLLRVCLLYAVSAGTAAADDTTAAARDHYNRGSTLFDLGRFGEAAREFEAAYEAKNDPALLYNLGQAYRADGQYQKALVSYRAFLRKSDNPSRRPEVEARIAELQQLIEQQKAASSKPPTDTIPPNGVKEAPRATTTAPPALVATAPEQPPRTPVYKRWWLWTAVGVVVAGAATGIAVALTTPKDASIPPGATPVMFH